MLYGARRKVWRYRSDSVITPWHTCARRRGTLNRKGRLYIYKGKVCTHRVPGYCPNEFSARQRRESITKTIATVISPAWCLGDFYGFELLLLASESEKLECISGPSSVILPIRLRVREKRTFCCNFSRTNLKEISFRTRLIGDSRCSINIDMYLVGVCLSFCFNICQKYYILIEIRKSVIILINKNILYYIIVKYYIMFLSLLYYCYYIILIKQIIIK